MKYPVYNKSGEEVKKVDLNPAIFEVEADEGLVHQTAMAQIANARINLAHTKDKSEVRGGGKKPWRQKGTGRARHGSIRSPLWKGGGVTFGPTKDINFSKKINKKMKRKALFMCLSDRAKDNQLVILDELILDEAKTKIMNKLLNKLIGKLFKQKKLSVLVVGSEKMTELARAGRNIEGIKVIGADSLNIIDILKYKYLVLDEKGLGVIEKTYLI